MLYQINYIMLFIIGIIAASIALYRIRVLAFRELSEEDAFDDNLLLLGLVAVLFYDLFLLIPAVGATEEHKKAGAMFVGKSILEMVQALLQVGHQKSVRMLQMAVSCTDEAMVNCFPSVYSFMYCLSVKASSHSSGHSFQRLSIHVFMTFNRLAVVQARNRQ